MLNGIENQDSEVRKAYDECLSKLMLRELATRIHELNYICYSRLLQQRQWFPNSATIRNSPQIPAWCNSRPSSIAASNLHPQEISQTNLRHVVDDVLIVH
jgi:hypothetical protein